MTEAPHQNQYTGISLDIPVVRIVAFDIDDEVMSEFQIANDSVVVDNNHSQHCGQHERLQFGTTFALVM